MSFKSVQPFSRDSEAAILSECLNPKHHIVQTFTYIILVGFYSQLTLKYLDQCLCLHRALYLVTQRT